MKVLVTGCCGLVGSSVLRHLAAQGHAVVGLDNNMRKFFFGDEGDTSYIRADLAENIRDFRFFDIDIRDQPAIFSLFEAERFEAVVHCAAQPSHDKAAQFPLIDFSVNATGTLTLLEANRTYSPDAPFVHMSTNKVYGDAPNEIAMVERETRWDYADPDHAHGIAETFRIDASKHSVFGASKVAADVMVQEYGRYFGMPTCCLRGGCLTGPDHSGVELHGFLSYLVKCNVIGRKYTIYGYKGKQVRDNIHTLDVARFIDGFIKKPRVGAIYNIGGGKANTISVLEAFSMVAGMTGKPMVWEYSEKNRIGDHICYYSDLRRMKADYPDWDISKDVATTIGEIVEDWEHRLHRQTRLQEVNVAQ